MNQDFSELIEYLDGKFGKVDEKLAKTATKEDVFELRIQIQNLAERVEKLEESVHHLTTAIDSLAKAIDDLRIEYSAIAMQTTRHEKWIQQLAGKLGMKLEY